MNVRDLINKGVALFKDKKFDEAIAKLNQALDGIEDKDSQIQQQNDIHFWLGRCYYEQAMKAEDGTADALFGQAIGHFQQSLDFAEQLTDEQDSLQQQIYAQHWLGGCYYEQAMKAKGEESEQLFGQAVGHFQQQLNLAKQLTDKQNSRQGQIYAQAWLGRCHYEQAKKAERKDSKQLFGKAIEHFQQQLTLAEQLEDKKNRIQQQSSVQAWLGRCHYEQAKKAERKDSEQLFGKAIEHFQQQLTLAEQLEDKKNRIQQQSKAQSWLGRCYYEQARKADPLSEQVTKKWDSYFKHKKKVIQEKLFKNQPGDLTDAISTILAVLNIPPVELDSIPLAHYTSPSVCERLFGMTSEKTDDKAKDPVDGKKASPMRIGSSTYMNDPTEVEGLLELLNLQDLELENKADCPDHNAFFTCFSSRINDLNQFRLYGKENGVEASGCCLVFNKNGDWLKDSDVSASFRIFMEKSNESTEENIKVDISDSEDENLPLYQVAYIAYYDEYIAKEKCKIWLPDEDKPKFGIRLKLVGESQGWHAFRIGKLRQALKQLMKTQSVDREDRKALEYIRYLFKDFAFRDEEEFRLLKIAEIGSEEIQYCEATKSVYLPYADIRDIVDEVILGTNYEKSGNNRKAEVFQHLMRKYYPNVKVSRSLLPINANPPIKKD
ncbi:sel1 repeat family protein [Eikenella sp. S3360]|uniref:Sel1 repeat family protein n=1 Tax=Eikenella glucosivorans TaxID=2766967 RepID=A0ABS0ND49_9NEIS|nr:sel1 repeat family protein [Eikenella glucosivorans]MBH5330174.1 sel1 repeat family protein [Eikenella glucosivorans]